jgi:hypothetical protein
MAYIISQLIELEGEDDRVNFDDPLVGSIYQLQINQEDVEDDGISAYSSPQSSSSEATSSSASVASGSSSHGSPSKSQKAKLKPKQGASEATKPTVTAMVNRICKSLYRTPLLVAGTEEFVHATEEIQQDIREAREHLHDPDPSTVHWGQLIDVDIPDFYQSISIDGTTYEV